MCISISAAKLTGNFYRVPVLRDSYRSKIGVRRERPMRRRRLMSIAFKWIFLYQMCKKIQKVIKKLLKVHEKTRLINAKKYKKPSPRKDEQVLYFQTASTRYNDWPNPGKERLWNSNFWVFVFVLLPCFFWSKWFNIILFKIVNNVFQKSTKGIMNHAILLSQLNNSTDNKQQQP